MLGYGVDFSLWSSVLVPSHAELVCNFCFLVMLWGESTRWDAAIAPAWNLSLHHCRAVSSLLGDVGEDKASQSLVLHPRMCFSKPLKG